jgi:hypothetical protein
MNADEAIHILLEFTAKYAGTPYDQLLKYEAKEVTQEVALPCGKVYSLFLCASLIDISGPSTPAETYSCDVRALVTPVEAGKPSKTSISGHKEIMPGQMWDGSLDDISTTTLPSMTGCYISLAVVGVVVFAIVYGIQSCRLAR